MRKDPILWEFSLKLSSTRLFPSAQDPERSDLCSHISQVSQPLLFAQNQHPPDSQTGHLTVNLPPQLVYHAPNVLSTSSSRVRCSLMVVSVSEELVPAKRISFGTHTLCKKDQPISSDSLAADHISSPICPTWSDSFIESHSPPGKTPPLKIPASA